MPNLVFLLWFVPLTLATSYLTSESPDSCICERLLPGRPGLVMTCSFVANTSVIPTALKDNPGVVWLNLVNCSFTSLPSLPNSLVHLQIINSTISYISSPGTTVSAFDGLNVFSSLTLIGVTDLREWDWSHLQNMKNLHSITIEKSRLPFLSYQFQHVGSSRPWSLKIINSGLRHIEPKALGSATLHRFVSRGNSFGTLTVQMFDPARAVVELELVGTGMSSLTTNIPDNLRKLHALHIDYQILSLLTPAHFSSSNVISSITVEGRPGPCTCQLAFLRKYGLGGTDKCTVESLNGTIQFPITDIFSQMC